MYGRCRAGKVVYLVNLGSVGLCDIVADKLEMVVTYEMAYVVFTACEIVVEADDIVAVI
jgi:hypothetical protein